MFLYRYVVCLRIFKFAAYYTMIQEVISDIMKADQMILNLQIKTLAAISIYKYEAADTKRNTFQEEVFAPLQFQMHLNLQHEHIVYT